MLSEQWIAAPAANRTPDTMNNATQLLLSRDESRHIDGAAVSELGLTGLLLMENAARSACDVILREFSRPANIVILCGPGNNGGDGFAVARQLSARGVTARVFLTTAGRDLTSDAEFNRQVWLAAGYEVEDGNHADTIRVVLENLKNDDLVVDCLLGTGIRGAVREPFDGIIAAVNLSPAQVLAIDVPSGLDCESGDAAGECIRADRTITFVGMKTGFVTKTARPYTGPVETGHIGLPEVWVREWVSRYRAGSGSDGASSALSNRSS